MHRALAFWFALLALTWLSEVGQVLHIFSQLLSILLKSGSSQRFLIFSQPNQVHALSDFSHTVTSFWLEAYVMSRRHFLKRDIFFQVQPASTRISFLLALSCLVRFVLQKVKAVCTVSFLSQWLTHPCCDLNTVVPSITHTYDILCHVFVSTSVFSISSDCQHNGKIHSICHMLFLCLLWRVMMCVFHTSGRSLSEAAQNDTTTSFGGKINEAVAASAILWPRLPHQAKCFLVSSPWPSLWFWPGSWCNSASCELHLRFQLSLSRKFSRSLSRGRLHGQAQWKVTRRRVEKTWIYGGESKVSQNHWWQTP